MTINLSTFLGSTFQGNTGIQGVQGLQGLQGNQGLQGLQGRQGTQGVQGLQGLQGNQGLQGLQGRQGTQGVQGTQGLSNQGVQGSQGSLLLGIPASSNTTIVSSDAGKHINIDANVTINSSTGFSIGDMCTIYNRGTVTRTITATGITLRWAGTSSTGNRSLLEKGLANVLCVGANDYVISGAGII